MADSIAPHPVDEDGFPVGTVVTAEERAAARGITLPYHGASDPSAPKFTIGDWVRFGYKSNPGPFAYYHHGHGRVVKINPDTGNVLVERWTPAKITRRLKAFGQRVDHSPYRVVASDVVPVVEVKLVAPAAALQYAQVEEQVMRLPTYGQRAYRRQKAKAARLSRGGSR